MQAGTLHTELSRAFQTALGMLVTNVTVARRVLAGQVQPRSLSAALTDSDVACLETLVETQRDRMLAVAELMTGRRRGKAMALLPATRRILSGRLEAYWTGYLESDASRAGHSPAADAAAFAAWTLDRLESSSLEAQLVRYELCQSDVANRISACRVSDAGLDSVVLPADCRRIRLSDCARIERFECRVDQAMRRFRQTGQVSAQDSEMPVYLVFHRLRASVGFVAVTKVSAGMGSVLEAASSGLDLRDLLSGLPEPRRAIVRGMLEKFVAMDVLETQV